MVSQVYTDNQRAFADLLLSRSHLWTRGTRKRDGLAFVIFESSRKGPDGQPVGYYATESGCTCRGFLHRGRCSHELAVRLEAERAREQAARKPRRGYRDLFPADEYDRPLVDAF